MNELESVMARMNDLESVMASIAGDPPPRPPGVLEVGETGAKRRSSRPKTPWPLIAELAGTNPLERQNVDCQHTVGAARDQPVDVSEARGHCGGRMDYHYSAVPRWRVALRAHRRAHHVDATWRRWQGNRMHR